MATKSILITAVLVAVTTFCPLAARADSYDAGLRAMAAGNIQEALKKFQRSSRPEAPYQIAELAYNGKVSNCDRKCSVTWYVSAVQRGLVSAYIPLGMMAYNEGNKERAIEYFTICARWNLANCQDALATIGATVPPADLWEDQQRAIRQAEIAKREEDIKNQQEALAYFSGQWGFGQPAGTRPQPSPSSSYTLCPNGSFVAGDRCNLAPNGQFVGGTPTLAPDGTFVAGRPTLAPNGTFVGGNGRVTLCNDGSFVGGNSCVLTPNGHFVAGP